MPYEPLKTLRELDRVRRPGGKLIIPAYMIKDRKGQAGGSASAAGNAGRIFQRRFTAAAYRLFFPRPVMKMCGSLWLRDGSHALLP